MDQASVCSNDLSDGLSNDTFEIRRRRRQDTVTIDARLLSENPIVSLQGDVALPHLPTSSAAPAVLLSSTRFSRGAPGIRTKPRRNVNFGGSSVINDCQRVLVDADETHIRWWTQEDLEQIKQAAKEMSLRLRRQAQERGCVVETAHKKTTLMLTNNFQELVKLSPSSPDQDLLHWCARSDGRRGLERFASREYGAKRKDDVLNTRTAVFQEQDRLRAIGTNAAVEPEALAKVSREKSRRARTFSLFMGEADAQAVARGGTGPSSKRCKVAQSNSSRSLPKANPSYQVTKGGRGFPMDAPLLKSLA